VEYAECLYHCKTIYSYVKVTFSRYRPNWPIRWILSWPRHQKGMRGQHHAPAVLTPGKTQYPLYRRLGGPQDRSGHVRRVSPHRDSIPGLSSPLPFAIPTEIPDPYIRVGTHVSKNKRKLNSNWREFGFNLISNTVCAISWNVVSTQNFEYEIFRKTKRRKIDLTCKRRPEFCLSLANKRFGRTADE
jgi:hypothetical protein